MRAVGGGDDIIVIQGGADADGTGFLALILMNRAGHNAFQEQELYPLFEPADQQHFTIDAQKKLFRIIGI